VLFQPRNSFTIAENTPPLVLSAFRKQNQSAKFRFVVRKGCELCCQRLLVFSMSGLLHESNNHSVERESFESRATLAPLRSAPSLGSGCSPSNSGVTADGWWLMSYVLLLMAWGSGLRAQGLGLRVECLGLRAYSLGLRA